MATVVTGIGSNVGDRHQHLTDAKAFLRQFAGGTVKSSSIYLTEPVGPSKRYFLNAIAVFETEQSPTEVIAAFKEFENEHGRPQDHPRWSPRTIDLDIIAYNSLVVQKDKLILPHPEYHKRWFVLFPLRELFPGWKDPRTGAGINEMITKASKTAIRKTELPW